MKDNIQITVIDRNGDAHKIKIPLGIPLNLMECLRGEGFPIEGTCGGMALCASCHIYKLSDHTLSPMQHEEKGMLSEVVNYLDHSRLACQIPIEEKLDGLVLAIAPEE